ncbi:MAG: hypothetical protein ACYSTT_02570 [Planctomycetota bacterium]|jgi:hypothetical protein
MFDIFEQPWTLVGVAVLVLFGMLTFRSFCPERRRWWQLLIPVFLIAAAFSIDMFVQTDLEKINAVIEVAINAVQQEDYRAIEAVIADDYSDSNHSTKQHLLEHCRRELSKPLVDKIKKAARKIDISDSNATANLFLVIILDKNSYLAQYKSFLMVKSRLSLRKQPDKRWLISRIEILEIDRQPFNWSRIR